MRQRASREDFQGVWLFFALVFLISWGVGGVYLLFPHPLTDVFGPFIYGSPAYLLAACAPTLVGLGLTLAFEGPKGLAQLGQRLLLVRPAWALALAFLILPAIALSLSLLAPRFSPWPVRPGDVLVATPMILFTTAQILANSGPLGEELGWRGYALPRLLDRWPPLIAGGMLGLIWTIWHIPAFLFSGIVATPLSDLGWYALGTVALSLLMTWLFLRTRGSVLIAGIIPHFVINGLGAVGAWRARPAEAVTLALLTLALFVLWPPNGRKSE